MNTSKKVVTGTAFLPLLVFGFLVLCCSVRLAHGSVSSVPERVGVDSDVLAMMSGASIPFIENTGQLGDSRVGFYVRTFGGTVFVTHDGEMVYSLLKFGERDSSVPHSRLARPRPVIGSTVLRERLIGARSVALAGRSRSDAEIAWHKGADPERWRENVPLFEEVSLGEVYHGISMHLRAHSGSIEKIFTVAPGVDPEAIRFTIDGASGISIAEDGSLLVGTEFGPVTFSAPIAFQTEAGKTLDVQVAYSLENDVVAFNLGSYDKSLPLVIDPLLASTYIGGTLEDSVEGIAIGPTEGMWDSGSVYVTGYTVSQDFPSGPSGPGGVRGAGYDVFVSQFSRSARTLLGTYFLGGASNDIPTAIAVDSAGVVFITGYTESPDFPLHSGGYTGGRDVFIARFSSDLTSLNNSYVFGGSSNDVAMDLKINPADDRVFIVGYTDSTNFPVTPGAHQQELAGESDIFVASFDKNVSAGSRIATYLGGAEEDRGYGICLDTTNVYITGYTETIAPPFELPDNNVRWDTNSGNGDAFVAAFNHALTTNHVFSYLGGTAEDGGYAIDVGTNLVYVTGYTYSPDFKTNSNYNTQHSGGMDVFLSSFEKDFNTMPRSIFIGGIGDDVPYALNATRVGKQAPYTYYIDVAGYTTSTNFPVSEAAYKNQNSGNDDGFIFRMESHDICATNMAASTYVGGFGNDRIKSMAVFSSTNGWGLASTRVWVAGATESDGMATDGAYDTSYNGNKDGFLSRFAGMLTYGSVKWRSHVIGNAGTPALDWDGNIYFGTDMGRVYSLNQYGHTNWVFTAQVGDPSTMTFNDAPATLSPQGVLYVADNGKAAGDPVQGTRLYALDASSGALKWTFYSDTWQADDGIRGSPALNADGSILYFGVSYTPLGGPVLYALRDIGHTNEVVWSQTNGPAAAIDASPVVGDDGTVYFSLVGGPPNLLALDPADGSQIWGSTFEGVVRDSSMAIDTNANIYLSSTFNLDSPDPMVYSFSSDGKTNWSRTNPPKIASRFSPVVGTNGYVHFGADDGYFYGYEILNHFSSLTWNLLGKVRGHASIGRNGTIYVGSGGADSPGKLSALKPGTSDEFLWRSQLEWYTTNALSGTAIAADGTIYIGSGSNMVAVFSAESLGETPWPTFQHDVMRSGNFAFRPAPPAPAWVTATNEGFHDRIVVRWDAVSNAAIYEVWRSTDSISSNAVQTATTIGTAYNDQLADPGREYWYWVKSKHSLGTSDFSPPGSGGKPPAPPTGVHASDDIDERIYIAWNGDEYATGYQLWRSLQNDTNTAQVIHNAVHPATNYFDEVIEIGETYYYWVKTLNEFGVSHFSSNAVGGTPPLRPDNIQATDGVYDNKVRVTWDRATGVNKYEVWSSRTANSNDASYLGLATTNFYNDTTANVKAFVTNFYWIKSTNQFGISSFSEMASGWRDLPAPKNVTATDGTYPNKVGVSWSPVPNWNLDPDADSYQIWRNTVNDTDSATLVTYTFSTNYMDTSISTGFRYYYWLRSVCDLGTSKFSAYAIGGTPPLRPTDIRASDGLYLDKIEVTWTAASGATGYELRRSETSIFGDAVQIHAGSGTNYNDTSADIGKLYYYWVKATNTFASSPFSVDASGFKAIASPAGLSASSGDHTNKIAVSWNAVEGAAGYELWRSDTNNINSAAKLIYQTSRSYDDTDIVKGLSYYYWVKARNSIYASSFSDVAEGYAMLGLADISVSDFVFLPSIVGPGNVPEVVSMRVANHGTMDVSIPNSRIAVSIYLATNAYLQVGSDIFLGTLAEDFSLRPGQGVSMVFSAMQRAVYPIPADVAAGKYYVLAHVEHTSPSRLYDPDKSDNVSVKVGMLTVKKNPVSSDYRAFSDYDGDGRANLAVYDPANGRWYIRNSTGGAVVWGEIFGGPGFTPVVGDFNGDKRSDMAVYHEPTGKWYARSVGSHPIMWAENWGGPGFVPVWGDYNGNGVTDLAVYHPESGMWYVRTVSGSLIAWAENWGGSGFSPVWGDYTGNGVSDFAVYFEELWHWYIRSVSGSVILWADDWGGQTGFIPVSGDYNGDGRSDQAVYHQETGYWFIKTVSGEVIKWGEFWGGPGFTPVPGDYDGDGVYDLAVYHDNTGAWYVQSVSGAIIFWDEIWGAPWMRPVWEAK